MKYKIEGDKLIITVTVREQRAIRKLWNADPDNFHSDEVMYNLLEPLVTNNEFHWIEPYVTGDLTSAPMLGLLGDTEPGPSEKEAEGSGLQHVGAWDHEGKHRQMYQPVLYRWAFMSYEVEAVQQALVEKRRAVFTGGKCLEREGQLERLTVTEGKF
jgi:hypothetical protein